MAFADTYLNAWRVELDCEVVKRKSNRKFLDLMALRRAGKTPPSRIGSDKPGAQCYTRVI